MKVPSFFTVTWSATGEFLEHNCPRKAAALSYYAIFSLPALLIIVITSAGWIYGEQAARGQLESEIETLVGETVAGQVETMIDSVDTPGSQGLWAAVVGIIGLLIAATGAFTELQQSLNESWGVEASSGIKNFVLKRLFSLIMILGIGAMLVVFMLLSAILAALDEGLGNFAPLSPLFSILNAVVSYVLIAVMIAALFKILPDLELRWRDVWVGAGVTAFLFALGKGALAFYLAKSAPGSAFGASASLALLMLWIYYSAMIVFFGAEFTQEWAERDGKVRPEATT
jgi:membrane protein